MKNYFMLAFMALALTANAQEEKKTTIEVPAWVKNVKFSGYGMLQYQGSDQDGAESNTFKLRLARFILEGKIGDFDWRAQIQGTNATGPEVSETVQVKRAQEVAISVSSSLETCSQLLTDTASCTIR